MLCLRIYNCVSIRDMMKKCTLTTLTFTPQHIILKVKQHAVDLYVEPCFGNHGFYSDARIIYVLYNMFYISEMYSLMNSAVEMKPSFGIIDYVVCF